MSTDASSPDTHQPPTAFEVGMRIIVLTHVVASCHFAAEEQQAHAKLPRGPIADAARESTEKGTRMFWSHVRAEGLDRWFSPKERRYREVSFLDIPHQQLVDGTWQSEALQMLLWAVGKVPDLSNIWEDYAEREIGSIPNHAFAQWAEQCVLRPASEIEDQRDAAELWLWRCRTRQLQSEGTQPRADINSIVSSAASTAHLKGWVGPPIRGDFNVAGTPFSELPEDRWRSLQSVSLERLRALNWLCGMATDNQWDMTPLDT